MERAILQRLEQSDEGTFGRFFAEGLTLYSGELPPRGNASNVSCVLAGTYVAILTWSPRFGRRLYLLTVVPARAGIRVHPANLMGDASKGLHCQLNGCIALGQKLGWMDGQKALLLSAPAVSAVERVFAGRPFQLEIRDPG